MTDAAKADMHAALRHPHHSSLSVIDFIMLAVLALALAFLLQSDMRV